MSIKRCLQNLLSKGDKTGFTLVELAIALVIISVIMVISTNIMDDMKYADRFRKTMNEIERLSVALGGNPKMVQTGHQAEFGFYEVHVGFPDNLFELYELMYEPVSVNLNSVGLHDFMFDEWGNEYDYEKQGGLMMGGGMANGHISSDAGGTDNIRYEWDYDKYSENKVRLCIKDAKGTVLRGSDDGSDFAFHVARLQLTLIGGAGAGGVINYSYSAPGNAGVDVQYDSGFFELENIRPGYYLAAISFTPGSPIDANGDHIDDPNTGWYENTNLSGYYESGGVNNGEQSLRKVLVVYPRGSTVWQNYEIRAAGIMDPVQIGKNDESIEII